MVILISQWIYGQYYSYILFQLHITSTDTQTEGDAGCMEGLIAFDCDKCP